MTANITTEGKFIVLEGIDGSGLTTHAGRLQQWLNRESHKQAYLTKEPTTGPIGAQIRLKLGGRLDFSETTTALMFAADRMDHLERDILPRLRSGIHVICDRYRLSSLAYQSLTLDGHWIEAINAFSRRPDLTIFIDVPTPIAIERISRERWHVELYETETTLNHVRQNYHRMAKMLQERGENIVIIPGFDASGSRPMRDVEHDIRETVRTILGDREAEAS